MAATSRNIDRHTNMGGRPRSLGDSSDVPIQGESSTLRGKGLPANIEAIFLDLGDTLRILVQDEPFQAQARQRIAMLTGAQESPESLSRRLDERYQAYKKWALESMIEAPETDIWTRWLLPELPADRLAPLAAELTYLYRQSMGRRVMPPEARRVVIELGKRGYVLGIISNLTSTLEIPAWLEEEGLADHFRCVLLSCLFGRRKPDPAIFLEAARRAEVEPGRSAYVGDNPTRDVLGPRLAGFGTVIMVVDPAGKKKPAAGEHRADLTIGDLRELLEVFPGR